MTDPQTQPPSNWWAMSPQDLADRLDTDLARGLDSSQAARQRARYGSNEFEDTGPTSLWALAWESVRSPMMILLLAVAAISLLLGQIREAVVMVFVVAMYVGVHLLNKARSDRTMARLREVQAPTARVLRAGQILEIPAAEVVVGDVLPLQPGTRIAADGRLVSAVSLLVDEAALTGESAPVLKDAAADVASETPLAERETAVWAGTTVLDGQGRALVAAVGRHSELGRVAGLVAGAGEEPTPLQREMDSLAHTLAIVAVAVSLLIPLIGLLRGDDLQQMILTWLALTFLMVPGQPPIIISMALALAALELARRQVIVRRLHGAETLGAVTVVLSDKTGTMTRNEMVLSSVLLPGGAQVTLDDPPEEHRQALARFFSLTLPALPEDPTDPTDLALAHAAQGLPEFEAPARGRLVEQVGFTRGSTHRAFTYEQEGAYRTFVTGRPEFLIERSARRQGAEGPALWPAEERTRFEGQLAEVAGQGKRLAAYGYADGRLDGEPAGLVFLGVAAISDPIRPELSAAAAQLRQAGIRVVMVTGDIPQTAAHVARQIGLDGDEPVSGRDLDGLSESEYERVVERAQVFARTTPEHKLELVNALKRLGETVAVTGDGVNDAPALRSAHVGVAMGCQGTDVAREAADLILTDDSLAHLPDGVAVGRKAYDNFRKGITYYLSAKAILLSIFVVPLIAGLPFPLAPIQIILTELLMDLASSTIFVTEQAEPGLLDRPPRRRTRFLSWAVALRILRYAAGPIVAILAVYFGSLALGYGVDQARTAAFATWLLGHIVLAMNLKQRHTPLLRQGLLSNRFAAGWLAGMIVLVLAMTLLEPVRTVLKTTPLSGTQWLGVVAGAILGGGWIEVSKWVRTASRSR